MPKERVIEGMVLTHRGAKQLDKVSELIMNVVGLKRMKATYLSIAVY